MIKDYGPIAVAEISAENPADWDFGGATHARVELPAAKHLIAMQKAGFFWVDRTIEASISLAKCPLDLAKAIRLPVVATTAYKEDILRLACASFNFDRRFHLGYEYCLELASLVLRCWVEALGETLVCFLKGEPVGFLALERISDEALFVHLAAVEERSRLSGAALSLYARACQQAQEQGYKRLEGRISSQNMAVMNLYAAFGAKFSAPLDVFLKELNYDA